MSEKFVGERSVAGAQAVGAGPRRPAKRHVHLLVLLCGLLAASCEDAGSPVRSATGALTETASDAGSDVAAGATARVDAAAEAVDRTPPSDEEDQAERRFRADGDAFELDTADPEVRFVVDGAAVYLERGDERTLVFEPAEFERAGRRTHDARSGALVARGSRVAIDRGGAVEEWYQPRRDALEQGWTIGRRLGRASGPLSVGLRLGPEVTVIHPGPGPERRPDSEPVEDGPERDDSIVLFVRDLPVSYSGLTVTDASGAVLPSTLRVADQTIVLEIDDVSATFPVTIDPLVALAASNVPPTPSQTLLWGTASAIDGNNLFIGQPDLAATGSLLEGAVHQYTWNGTAWNYVRLIRQSGSGYAGFGAAIAVDGDWLVVGAPQQSGKGYTHVIRLSGGFNTSGIPLVSRALTPTESVVTFGASVSISGNRLVVGAPLSNRAHVYNRSGDYWSVSTANKLTGTGLFGASVALDRQNPNLLVVGAPNEATRGIVRIYEWSASSWAGTQITPPFPDESDFGASVAVDGGRVAIGCTAFNDTRGELVRVKRSGSSWIPSAMLLSTGYISAAEPVLPTNASRKPWVAIARDPFLGDADMMLLGLPNGVQSSSGTGTIEGTVNVSPASISAAARITFGTPLDRRRGRTLVTDGRTIVIGNASLGLVGQAQTHRIGLQNGDACAQASQCASNSCVDGVCCNTACGDGATNDCQACSIGAGGTSNGTCTALSGTVAPTVRCRNAAGACDVDDYCTAGSMVCVDQLVASTTVCGAATHPCESTPACNGTSPACPATGAARPAGTACGAAPSGACDAQDRCNGTALSCPSLYAPAGTVCLAASDVCDVDDVCTGTSTTCTPRYRPSGDVCRPAADSCDIAEQCTGGSASCPPDAVACVLELPSDAFTDRIVPTEGHAGWTQGRGSVSQDGAAQFAIPLVVPAGRNGVQPNLALTYNSRNGDGMLGTGWSLSGLSMITRCARNELIDGQTRDVRFDAGDAFCLDGDRLVEPPPEGFWGGGQYRRWRNGFERISLEGGQPGDPNTVFRVEHPDGMTWIYGGPSDAYIAGDRVGAPGGVYAWLVTRVEDRFGNFMDFHYSRQVHPDMSVEVLPTEIIYTGHPSLGAGRRRVIFEYSPRPAGTEGTATVIQWINRLGLRSTQVLSRIVMMAPGEPSIVRDYRIDHWRSLTTPSVLLGAVEECDGHDVCREGLRFSYEDGAVDNLVYPTIQPAHDTSIEPYFHPSYPSTDLGRNRLQPSASIVGAQPHIQNSLQTSILRRGSAATNPSPFWEVVGERHQLAEHGALWDGLTAGHFYRDAINLENDWQIIPIDYDRDGDLELLRYRAVREYGGAWRTHLDLIEPVRQEGSVPPGVPRWDINVLKTYEHCLDATHAATLLADLDGNGVEDLIRGCESTTGSIDWDVFPHRGTQYGDYGPGIDIPLLTSVENPAVFITDWDGDGRQELLTPDVAQGFFVSVGLDEGGAPFVYTTDIPSDAKQPTFLDINGDGLTDLVTLETLGCYYPGRCDQRPFVRLNMGGTLGPPREGLSPTDPDRWMWDESPDLHVGELRVVDLNADGRDDFVAIFRAPECDNRHHPTRCLADTPDYSDIRAQGYLLGHLSTGEGFTTLRLGPGGLPRSPGGYDTTWAWPDTQFMDLGADGLVDFIFPAHRPCSSPGDPSCTEYFGTTTPSYHVRPNPYRRAPDLLIQVSSHAAVVATYQYKHTSASAGTCEYPSRCAAEGLHVVSEFRDELDRTERHWYQGPRADVRTGALLGFRTHYSVDETTGTVVERRFDNNTDVSPYGFVYAGLPSAEITYTPITNAQGPGFRLVHVSNEYKITALSSRHHAVQLREQRRTVSEPSTIEGGCVSVEEMLGCSSDCRACSPVVLSAGPTLSSQKVTASYDSRGTLLTLVQDTPGVRTDTVAITPEHRQTSWLIGLHKRVETTSVSRTPINTAATRVVSHQYDARGFRYETRIEPDNPSAMLIRDAVADPYGNVFSVTERATGYAPRTTTWHFDPEERITLRVRINAEGHAETYAIHPGLGVEVMHRDANGVESRATYDGFGRPRSTWSEAAESAASSVDYWWSGSQMTVETSVPGHSHTQQVLDHLGRLHVRRERRPDGEWGVELYGYDAAGRLSSTSTGQPLQYVTRSVARDNLGRPITIAFGDSGPFQTIAYDGLITTVTDRREQQSVLVHDPLGRLVSRTVFDHGAPITVSRSYGPFGTLLSVEHSSGARWEKAYDAYGRAVLTNDPDAGQHVFEYTPFGELVLERRAPLGPVVGEILSRDRLGRVTSQWHVEDGPTNYAWDTAPHGVGRLASATSPDDVTTRFTYDEYGRPEWTHQELLGEETLSVMRKYDAYGRVRQIGYPSTPMGSIAINYHYDPSLATGRVAQVVRDSSAVLWTAQEYDPLGRVRQSSLGNGVQEQLAFEAHTGWLTGLRVANPLGDPLVEQVFGHDAEGNVISRDDLVVGTSEIFEYDGLGRLERWVPDFAATAEYDHDTYGNLVLNAGVVQHFGEGGRGPHQISRTDAVPSFSYDSRGRRTSGADDWTVAAYRSNGLPAELSHPTEPGVSLEYDAFGTRVRTTSTAERHRYLGQLYERIERAGDVSHVFRVSVEGRGIAEIRQSDAGEQTLYYHQDHLGSVIGITDEAGDLVQRVAYEPYGERHITDATGLPADPLGTIGFTSHEHEGGPAWINMQGRIYDPAVGGFLTPDPIIRSDLVADALNAYGYVENNPLTLNDPTGMCPNGCRDELTYPPEVSAAGWIGLLAAWLIEQSRSGGTSGGSGSAVSIESGSRGSRRQERHATGAPEVADASGTPGAPTLNTGAGVRQHAAPAMMALQSGVGPPDRRAERMRVDALYRGGVMQAHQHGGTAWDFVAGLGNTFYGFTVPGLLGDDLVAVIEDAGIRTGVNRYSVEYGEFTVGPNLQDALLMGVGGAVPVDEMVTLYHGSRAWRGERFALEHAIELSGKTGASYTPEAGIYLTDDFRRAAVGYGRGGHVARTRVPRSFAESVRQRGGPAGDQVEYFVNTVEGVAVLNENVHVMRTADAVSAFFRGLF